MCVWGLNPLSSPQGTWIIKGLFLLFSILVIPRWDGSASPLPSGPAEHPAGDGTWAEMAASRGLMRANEGHTCRPRSKPGNPGTQTWPRLALQVQGPPPSGLRRHQGLPHPVLPPTSVVPKVNSFIGPAPHPGQETVQRATSSFQGQGLR